MEGKLPGYTPERAYALMRSFLQREGSHFLEEKSPEFLKATQGRGRLTRTFAVFVEPIAVGAHIRIEVTSAEDWPIHVRAALRRLATGLGISGLGVALVAYCLANRIGDVPLVASIFLLSAGAPVIVTGWALYGNAKMMMTGEATALWLG